MKYDLLLCCGSDSMKLLFGVFEYKDHAQKKSNYKRSIAIFCFAKTASHLLRSFLAIALSAIALGFKRLLHPLLDTGRSLSLDLMEASADF